MSVVLQLVFAYRTDAEIMRLRVADHQTADTGVREHGAMFRKADADGGKVDQTVEIKVEALVWQTGVSYCRTDSLKVFCVEVCNA